MHSILIGQKTQLPDLVTSLNRFFEDLLEHEKDLERKIGVIDATKKISFGQLNAQANQIARVLIQELDGNELETKNNDLPILIVVRFEPDVDLIITLLAILKAGMAYLPMSPDWPKSRIEYLIDDAKPLCVITNMVDRDVFPNDIKILDFETLRRKSLDESNVNLKDQDRVTTSITLRDNNIFAVMYTSDSVLAVMLGGDHHKEPLPHKLPSKVETISEFIFSNELRAVHNLFPEKKGIP